MNDNKNRLVLVDGHAMLYRAFFAYPQSLTTREGELINAVYGFTSILLNVLRQLKPSHWAVSFDVGKTFRNKEYPKYKAHREKMPDELKVQEGRAFEVVETLNIPLYVQEGFEADDVIGTLALQASSYKSQATSDKINTIIVTGDKDTLQLVADEGKGKGAVQVYMPGRGAKGPVIYDEVRVVEDLGVRADQIPDYKGLAGDSSDNIPGVRGVGPKTAVRLLQVFGEMETLYEYLEARGKKQEARNEKGEQVLKSTLIERLVAEKESAFQSKRLATIVRDVPVELDMKRAEVRRYDKEKTIRLFEEMEFTSLINKLPKDEFEESVQEALF